jgi:hypothetical protein
MSLRTMTYRLPTQLRDFIRGQILPALALALAVGAWIGLTPWRPILAGDDFGYYDSVVRTLTEGRPIVSDWLSPTTVGLTVPAAGMTWLVGDLWAGSMATMGLFGVLGLAALWLLLHELHLPPARIALTMLVVGFFPVYIGKWTRFESSLPSVSLLLAALALFVRVLKARSSTQRPAWLVCLAAGLCIAWAIAIRQNHAVVVLVGALGLLVTPGLRRRALLLMAWTLPTAIALIALRVAVPPSFAQRTATLSQVIDHFSALSYLAALFRAVCFASGMATLVVLMIAPGTIVGMIRQMTRRSWLIGLTSSGTLLLYAAQRPGWLRLNTDILAFQLVQHSLLIAIVLLGALSWWPVLTGALRSVSLRYSCGLLLMVVGYLVLVAAWGYWEYYFLEPTVLLTIMLLLRPSDEASRAPTARPQQLRAGRMAWVAAIAIYVALSWNIQRMSNDAQVTQLRVIEYAFRDRIAIPADIDQAPFGLLGWNLFPHQVTRWSASRQGFSLAFWELQSRDPAVSFRWGCPDSAVDREREEILRAGTAQVGWQQQCWSLVEHAGGTRPTPLSAERRYLPLTVSEWQQLLAANTNI